MGNIGIAVVGTGYWGVNYVRALGEMPGIGSLVVCEKAPDRLQEIGRRFHFVELRSDLEDTLAMPSVKAVVIATPATTHYEVAKRCLMAGKHVLVEKPITTKASEAEELMELAEERGLTLMVGHTFIHNPGVQKLKSYMASGDLGRPYYLYARRTNMGPIRKDVSAIWDLAPHDVSIFNYLLDEVPEWASAVGARVLGNGLQDVGFISLGYPSGVVGHIHVSWADPYKVREIVVVGSDRRVVFDDLNILERVRVFEKGVRPAPEPSSYGEHQMEMRDGDIISPRIAVGEPLKNQCQHFLECIREGQAPITGAREGLAVVRVMNAIDRSVSLNGAPVEIAAERVPVLAGLVNDSVVLRPVWERESGRPRLREEAKKKSEAA